MPQPPADVALVQNFGYTIVASDENLASIGEHYMIGGTKEAVLAYFSKLDRFWLGEGQPFEERFIRVRMDESKTSVIPA
jgi:hypothetical protein